MPLSSTDPKIFSLIHSEANRQTDGAELIASENFTSDSVMEAQGSILTNKYAEGLPGRRYYGGCEFVDGVEQLAIDRICELFGAVWANVQPHSGASANAALIKSTFLSVEFFALKFDQNSSHILVVFLLCCVLSTHPIYGFQPV